jgi:amino acid permease
MAIIVKENIDFQDFMEANFPQVLRPFYTKRYFLINIIFALVFIFIVIYLSLIQAEKHSKLTTTIYIYTFFVFLFTFLAFYLVKRETKIYRNLVNEINDLQTTYYFEDKQLKVKNKKTDLTYSYNDLQKVIEKKKWLILQFKNDEKVVIYKPNLTENDLQNLLKRIDKSPDNLQQSI